MLGTHFLKLPIGILQKSLIFLFDNITQHLYFDFYFIWSQRIIIVHLTQSFKTFRTVKCIFHVNVIIIIRNGKLIWKHGPYCRFLRLNLKYLGWSDREYIKRSNNGHFCEYLLSENNFDAVLATFCCYDYGANTTETVHKFATGQKDYCKCSLCVIVC